MQETQGDSQAAVGLYLKAGLPAKAARLAMGQEEVLANVDLVNRIATALLRGDFFEQVTTGQGLPMKPVAMGTRGWGKHGPYSRGGEDLEEEPYWRSF